VFYLTLVQFNVLIGLFVKCASLLSATNRIHYNSSVLNLMKIRLLGSGFNTRNDVTDTGIIGPFVRIVVANATKKSRKIF
jgi:hypothetical protein